MMSNSLRVFAPASMGNVSVGFDLLGGALAPVDGYPLGDFVELTEIEAGIEVSTVGPFAHKLSAEPTDNIVYHCARRFFEELDGKGIGHRGVSLVLEKCLPVGSGLGSSAASVVAALYGLNELYQAPLSCHELLVLMGELEGEISGSVHYDNVAPSYLGGLQLMLELPGQICDTVPSFDEWYWVVAYSGVSVSTAEARNLLPAILPLKTSLAFGRNLAAFVHASHSGDGERAADLLVDIIAEPVRKDIIPGFVDAKQGMQELGAMACGISGSGPTLFAVTDNLAKAEELNRYLRDHYLKTEDGFSHICKLDTRGACRVAAK